MAHHRYCDWHCDQYDFECTCGETQPKAEWFDAHVKRAETGRILNLMTSTGVTIDDLRANSEARV